MLGSNDSISGTTRSGGANKGQRQRTGSSFSSLVNNPIAIGLAGLVAGIIIGLIIGWGIWPVQWKDAAAIHLRDDLKQEWVRMVADSYGGGYSTKEDAIRRLDELGDQAVSVMDTVFANPGTGSTKTITALTELRSFYGQAEESIMLETPLATDIGTGEESDGMKTSSILLICAVLALAAVVIAAILYFRRPRRTSGVTAAMKAQQYSDQVAHTDYAAMGQEPPIAQWMTTYLKGDDLFDDSFSIDAPTGEFMGECGVGIAETIGVGEPKRVSAFEVWLFDKNDIQTVTKVLMSEHLFNDEVSHNRLAAKGEPILASPGVQFSLETETLQMVVRVVDMAYGMGALPDASHIDRLTLELSFWPR